MPLRSEKLRMKTLVIDTITLLCKNGLANNDGYSIEGVIGVSSLRDEDDVFLIAINEIVKNTPEKHLSESESDSTDNSYSARSKRKRKHRASKNVESEKKRTHSQEDPFSNVPPQVKLENDADSDSGDLVMVKEEPSPARQRQLQATQLNASESAVINEAVNNSITSLTPIHSYQPVPPGWSPHQMHGLPHPLPSHQQQQHQQQQHHLQQHQQPEPKQSLPQIQLPFPFAPPLVPRPTPSAQRSVSAELRDSEKMVLCKKILQCDGPYVTLRTATRKIGRYPSATIRTLMIDFLTTDPASDRFVGLVKDVAQISHKTTIFYKCPPHLLARGNIQKYGLSQEEYFNSYFRNTPDQNTGTRKSRSVVLIEEHSPFVAQGELERVLFKKLNDVQSSQEEEEEDEEKESTNISVKQEVNLNHQHHHDTASTSFSGQLLPLSDQPQPSSIPVPDFSQIQETPAKAQTGPQPIPSFVYSGEEEEGGEESDGLIETDLGAEEYI